MSYEYPDTISYEDLDYHSASYPLESYFRDVEITSPFTAIPHVSARGYWATWRVESERLFLVEIAGGSLSCGVLKNQLEGMFPIAGAKIFARWYTGTIYGFRGKRRYLGVPATVVFDSEISFYVAGGVVTSVRRVDNSELPDPTEGEMWQNLPEFLWPKE
jgi:hypothetical protein